MSEYYENLIKNLDDEKLRGELAEFERKLNNNESGFLPIDLKNDIQPFERKSQIVDEPTLNFIDSKIRREFGVPQAILDGDFTKDQLEAFYQHTLELYSFTLAKSAELTHELAAVLTQFVVRLWQTVFVILEAHKIASRHSEVSVEYAGKAECFLSLIGCYLLCGGSPGSAAASFLGSVPSRKI